MSRYAEYLEEIEQRREQQLHPKPVDDADLLAEIIEHIQDTSSVHRDDCLGFFVSNVLPGTTSAAGLKAAFLKDIVLGAVTVDEISVESAFEQLSHMKGGPSIEVLLDLTLGDDATIARHAADVLKTQVFLYEADMERLADAHAAGHELADEVLRSYAAAEFFTDLPDIDEEIEVVRFVAGVGVISTDLVSAGAVAHSRAVRVLLGTSMFEHD
ncbi:MAG: bifunctional aconitate hydratase 2/2-methylisocitrate dehydratase, partial [Actinomycetota bacterium]